ncbi:halocyanin hcpC [Salinarchaeum sp. Harcht-Bsk1]|uniref:plastocyanin/azurin family copper-binding protein n=1 Tax=Salinarchaeum sp. Harcht-Bsk1 TaxID=1333523 RepID=UPI00034237F0|nr:plastocyanin/azurin family copper-binding protein [Salinarchaeum sp. Harcht-Bsk1]AGN00271.1 halocyanin hcpC [Salinarchaeum sp. Harcht-Bsk1]
MPESYSRRQFVAGTSAVTIAALAGCSGGGGGDGDSDDGDGSSDGGGGGDNIVAVGPGGDLVFEPDEITISTGETVTWEFESPTHNVSAYPDMSEEISIPDGASGFGTMEEGGDAYETVSEGETFEHTFETAGEYTYVCVPHVASGMIGTIVVE